MLHRFVKWVTVATLGVVLVGGTSAGERYALGETSTGVQAQVGLNSAQGALQSNQDAKAAGKFNMSYLFFGSTSSYIAQVDQTKGSLDVVSPSYFNLSTDGNLQLSDAVDAAFVDAMHTRGIRVVPFLSNHWDRDVGVKALNNREALATQIVQAINQYKLDGINVDIENVTEAQRDSLTELVKLLRSKLPASKEVSVAVVANLTGTTKGWAASYDYKALAESSDYLMLMAYDESYPGDPTPGPVASLPFVKTAIESMLKQVPPEKLVLGIPFYGRYWNGVAASNGAGISNKQIDELVSKYRGVTRYDTASQSPVATFTIPSGDESSSVYGTKLSPGSYTLWYENEQSIKEKLKLVQAYGLKGSGSWSLNQEAANTWSYFDLWLDGFPWTDMEGHWAKPEVLAAANRGWLQGIAPDRFAPDAALTRAQAAAILVRVLGLTGEADGAASFQDVPLAHWAWHDIALAKQHGLIQGISDVSFAPDLPLTREQMSMLLTRVLGLASPADAAAKLPFPDVPAGSWSYQAIAALSARGLVDGFVDGTFRPGAVVTRAQMAVLLSRIAPLLNKTP
jgi:spore germination protein YaaH